MDKNQIQNEDEIAESISAEIEQLHKVIYQERRFYGMIVHEMRTQVGIISNLSEMLLDESLAASHDFYKLSLKQTSERVVKLSQDFLEIDQFNDHQVKLMIKPVDLVGFMDVFIMPYVHMAANKGLLLKLLVDEKCPKYINVDANRLGQILTNLVENAIKYTEQGQIQIHVHYDNTKMTPLMFDVIDTGIGLGFDDEDARARIFTEYARLDNALDKKGVGLGLWIIKNLAHAMGGNIQVETEHPFNKDGGSCFRLSLPIKVVQPINVKRTVPKVKEEHANNINVEDYTFLLVEDNKLNQHIIGTMLDGVGFNFDVAASLVEAKYLMNLRKYDLVLLDLNLPDGRGETLLETPDLPKLVALTADSDTGLNDRLIGIGFMGVIKKPIVVKDFFKVIYANLSDNPLNV